VIARGDVIVGAGSNDIEDPPAKGCPRIALPTGVGYELCVRCKQKGHAEISAIENADERAKANGLPLDLHGCDLYLAGHWWVCKDCWKRIMAEGINRVFIVL
jgi:pyrimidine deaminase RibD-like protein